MLRVNPPSVLLNSPPKTPDTEHSTPIPHDIIPPNSEQAVINAEKPRVIVPISSLASNEIKNTSLIASIFSKTIQLGSFLSLKLDSLIGQAAEASNTKADKTGKSLLKKMVYQVANSTITHLFILNFIFPQQYLITGLLGLISLMLNPYDASPDQPGLINSLIDMSSKYIFVPISELWIIKKMTNCFAKILDYFPALNPIVNLYFEMKEEDLDGENFFKQMISSTGIMIALERHFPQILDKIDLTQSFNHQVNSVLTEMKKECGISTDEVVEPESQPEESNSQSAPIVIRVDIPTPKTEPKTKTKPKTKTTEEEIKNRLRSMIEKITERIRDKQDRFQHILDLVSALPQTLPPEIHNESTRQTYQRRILFAPLILI
jgi:hypothetical protein